MIKLIDIEREIEIHGKKTPKILKILLILILCYFIFIVGMIVWEEARRPSTVNYQNFLDVRSGILEYIFAEERGVSIYQQHEHRETESETPLGWSGSHFAIISDKEEFISGLESTIIKGREGRYRGFKRYFDAGLFKILVHDNVCFLRW